MKHLKKSLWGDLKNELLALSKKVSFVAQGVGENKINITRKTSLIFLICKINSFKHFDNLLLRKCTFFVTSSSFIRLKSRNQYYMKTIFFYHSRQVSGQ